MHLRVGEVDCKLSKTPIVMGILNLTPDSFWDGGRYVSVKEALRRAEEMMGEGAKIIDVGGESTRPGSKPVSADEEIRRIEEVVRHLIDFGAFVSIDTRKALVARRMLEAGAHMINDVSGLGFDPEMVEVVRDFDVPVVIMHMRGTPENMQQLASYKDVVDEVKTELAQRVDWAIRMGIKPERIIIDPGIGFAKTAEHCVEIIARLWEFKSLGFPILVGPSRKSFIGKTLNLEPEKRLEATIACCLVCAIKGADIIRVHDPGPVCRALGMFEVIRGIESSKKRDGDDLDWKLVG